MIFVEKSLYEKGNYSDKVKQKLKNIEKYKLKLKILSIIVIHALNVKETNITFFSENLTMTKVKTKTVLVTGGSERLGRATNLAFAELGYNIAINFLHNKSKALSLQKECEKLGVATILVKADVSNPAQVDSMFKKIEKKIGSVDILVNNVGNFQVKNISKLTPKDWTHIIDTNLNSTFYCSQRALSNMRKKKFGRIINYGFSNVDSFSPKVDFVHYHTAKTGNYILTKALALEEAKNGITVNMVSPGIMFNSQPRPGRPKIIIPKKRYSEFADIIEAIIFFTMGKTDYITGQNITISGGYDL